MLVAPSAGTTATLRTAAMPADRLTLAGTSASNSVRMSVGPTGSVSTSSTGRVVGSTGRVVGSTGRVVGSTGRPCVQLVRHTALTGSRAWLSRWLGPAC